MVSLGRRPGKRDTRADIVTAARACFTEEGYDRASIRAIARRAGVDPALVHHYFAGKTELFMAVMSVPRDPGEIFDEVQTAPDKGAALARAFLKEWEVQADSIGPSPFVTTVQAVASSPEAAKALREFLGERVWDRPRSDGEAAGLRLRQSLVTSQLWGFALARYVLQIEPTASASLDQAAAWLGLLLEHTFEMPLPPEPPLPSGGA